MGRRPKAIRTHLRFCSGGCSSDQVLARGASVAHCNSAMASLGGRPPKGDLPKFPISGQRYIRLCNGARPPTEVWRIVESQPVKEKRVVLTRSWTAEKIADVLELSVDELPADFLVELRANGALLSPLHASSRTPGLSTDARHTHATKCITQFALTVAGCADGTATATGAADPSLLAGGVLRALRASYDTNMPHLAALNARFDSVPSRLCANCCVSSDG